MIQNYKNINSFIVIIIQSPLILVIQTTIDSQATNRGAHFPSSNSMVICCSTVVLPWSDMSGKGTCVELYNVTKRYLYEISTIIVIIYLSKISLANQGKT